jgi:hypothetical protein
MSKKVIGLALGLAVVLWLVFSVQTTIQSAEDANRLVTAAEFGELAEVRVWLAGHRGRHLTARQTHVMLESALWPLTRRRPGDPLLSRTQRMATGVPSAIRLAIIQARPTVQDEFCERLLPQAALENDLPVVKWLVEHGVNINSTRKPRDSEPGWTALALAARFGHVETVRYLLDHGADPNVTFTVPWWDECPSGWTILAFFNYPLPNHLPPERRIISLLKRHGAKEIVPCPK